MKSQKDIFKEIEGDNYFSRNLEALQSPERLENDHVLSAIKENDLSPKCILEIGCAFGHRLNYLKEKFKSSVFGIEPSRKAVEYGCENFKLDLREGVASDLSEFESEKFDLIIVGFCLYLCDRQDLFKIAYEVDRVLSPGGKLIIKDFLTPFPYYNVWSHNKGIKSFKMENSKMFLWNPRYQLDYRKLWPASPGDSLENYDNVTSVDILGKSVGDGFFQSPEK